MTTPAYITADDLAALLSVQEMADLAQSGVNVAAVLDAVNGEVDGCLSPLIGSAVLLTVPAAVKLHAAAIARRYLAKDVGGEDTAIYQNWQAAIRFFERVAEGKTPLKLELEDNPDTEEDDTVGAAAWSESGAGYVSEYDALFRGAAVDTDKFYKFL